MNKRNIIITIAALALIAGLYAWNEDRKGREASRKAFTAPAQGVYQQTEESKEDTRKAIAENKIKLKEDEIEKLINSRSPLYKRSVTLNRDKNKSLLESRKMNLVILDIEGDDSLSEDGKELALKKAKQAKDKFHLKSKSFEIDYESNESRINEITNEIKELSYKLEQLKEAEQARRVQWEMLQSVKD